MWTKAGSCQKAALLTELTCCNCKSCQSENCTARYNETTLITRHKPRPLRDRDTALHSALCIQNMLLLSLNQWRQHRNAVGYTDAYRTSWHIATSAAFRRCSLYSCKYFAPSLLHRTRACSSISCSSSSNIASVNDNMIARRGCKCAAGAGTWFLAMLDRRELASTWLNDVIYQWQPVSRDGCSLISVTDDRTLHVATDDVYRLHVRTSPPSRPHTVQNKCASRRLSVKVYTTLNMTLQR